MSFVIESHRRGEASSRGCQHESPLKKLRFYVIVNYEEKRLEFGYTRRFETSPDALLGHPDPRTRILSGGNNVAERFSTRVLSMIKIEINFSAQVQHCNRANRSRKGTMHIMRTASSPGYFWM
jgi:hypothetical protein